MCGLFGLVRPDTAAGSRAAERALRIMGKLSEVRGEHSAGVACWPVPPPEQEVPWRPAAGRRDVVLDGWRIVKQAGLFRHLPLPAMDLARARIVLGHTRQATQGDIRLLVNSSPLAVSTVIGTHNGDVTARPLRDRYLLPCPNGETDSEAVLAALADCNDPSSVLEVLSFVPGRVALVWAQRSDPTRLWMARGSLSPLSVAFSTTGHLLWASNPEWLRRLPLRLAGAPEQLPEGTLIAYDVSASSVREAGRWTYEPTVRPDDLELLDAIFRGFTPTDQAADPFYADVTLPEAA